MSHDIDDPGPLLASPSREVVSRFATADGRGGDCESAYRRGVSQALALASDLAGEASSLGQARSDLAADERAAEELRRDRYPEGRGHLLDCIRSEVDCARALRRRA
jgi:hypothetical protein